MTDGKPVQSLADIKRQAKNVCQFWKVTKHNPGCIGARGYFYYGIHRMTMPQLIACLEREEAARGGH